MTRNVTGPLRGALTSSLIPRLSFCLATALGAVALPAPAAAQETLAPGWQSALAVDPGGAVRELTDGRLVTFDGRFVDLWAPDGTHLALLADLGATNFVGAFAVAPSDDFAVVGESTNGDVFRVELDGSGATLLANLFFNYDAAFAPSGDLYVSAATGGFGTGNDVVRVDPATGATTTILHVEGPSGPIAFDALGNLFYATQSNDFPAPAGATDVLLFQAADIAAPTSALSEADGFLYAGGFDGASSMVCDRATSRVYLAETNFSNGVNRVRQALGSAAQSPILAEGQPFEWISVAQFLAGSGPALFSAFQPEGGGRLVYGRTDFASLDERRTLTPARASLTVGGPGVGGAGNFSLELAGLDPDGSLLLVWGPTALVGPELAVGVLPPLFTGLDLGTLELFPFQFGVDGAGAASITLYNPGGLEGLLTFQGLLLDGTGSAAGTSTMGAL